MGRIAGVPNKVTTEVKEKLEELIDGIVNSIDIKELTTNQKIKMLQISLQYTLPRIQASVISNVTWDYSKKEILKFWMFNIKHHNCY